MWTLLWVVGTVLVTVVISIGAFRAAGLKRLEDLIPPSKTTKWDHLREE